ncbi:N-acetylneuraminate synthase family protein [Thalassospira sp.]|uniref:N-acetylneuraminate synthase family protein n=1 Tax=Thalassospira sp. TaxID=1912094 RepID=UPI001B2F6138|nr:N-acetylneuraminate synthase family protein [Thalassospira sp.]MBO6805973.1 N-acetylneuraminate synthase family protein [Thalassospira sp.]
MLNKTFKIGERSVGGGESPYIIAEAGSNFNQSLDTARRLIDVAANAGADAVKFQLFRADVLYPNGGQVYEIFKSVQLDADWLPAMKVHAEEQGIHFSASAFDPYSIRTLLELEVPFMKVASSETTNLDLVARMAAANVPIFLSTGMCGITEISEALDVCTSIGLSDISLMQCQAHYPLEAKDVNLAAMDTMRSLFGGPVGFSDHTLGISTAIAAVGRGAETLEKHFTLDRKMEGPDHFYALEPDELKSMVQSVRQVHEAIGNGEKKITEAEKEVGRRNGIWLSKDVCAGELITETSIEIRRPAVGVKDRHLNAVSGTKAKHDLVSGSPLRWEDVDFS